MKKVLLIIILIISFNTPVKAQSTLALQEKCAEAAKKIVSEFGGCLPIYHKNYHSFCEYISHYNKNLDKCFIRFDINTIFLNKSGNPLEGKSEKSVRIMDVFENKIIGEYDTLVGKNEVNGKICNSKTEFEILMKPYMEE